MASSTEYHGPVHGHNIVSGLHATHGATINFTTNNHPSALALQPSEPFSIIPFPPDDDFIDRPEIMQWLNDKCARPAARAALVGLGGVGKSQLAIHYAYEVRKRPLATYVFWVHASTCARFEEGYRNIAERLNLPDRNNPDVNILRLVANWLSKEENGEWTLIIDNADEGDVFFSNGQGLAPFLPQSQNGYIVVTSRSMDVAERLVGNGNTLEVSTMNKNEALSLVREKISGDHPRNALEELVQTLDNIPLAITQAAAFINRRAPRMSIATYLEDMRKNDVKKTSILNKETGDLRRDPTASNSIVATWQITFDQIRRENRSAANLLSFMNLFNPQGIPESTLQIYSDQEDADFDEDLEVLRDYALVSTTVNAHLFEMHSLVQFCTQVWLSSADSSTYWRKRFLHIISDQYPDGKYEAWPQCQELQPHVDQIIRKAPDDPDDVEIWAILLSSIGWYYNNMGKYNEAKWIFRRATNSAQRILGDENDTLLECFSGLAEALRGQGGYKEAEKISRSIFETRERDLGPNNPKTLLFLSNLALVIDGQGRYEETEKMHQRVLEVRKRDLGSNHPDTLNVLCNLAGNMINQDKQKEGEVMLKTAIEIQERELGSNHPNTLWSLSTLATSLSNQEKYKDAEEINRNVLEKRERELGSNHPDTLHSLHQLASSLGGQGKYDEAEKINRDVLERRERELGSKHPDTIRSVQNLACDLHDQGRDAEALQLLKRAYRLSWEVFGNDDSKTKKYLQMYSYLEDKLGSDSSDGGRLTDLSENEHLTDLPISGEPNSQPQVHSKRRRNPIGRIKEAYKRKVSVRLKQKK